MPYRLRNSNLSQVVILDHFMTRKLKRKDYSDNKIPFIVTTNKKHISMCI
jgi:hypothetical protein